MTWSDVFYFLWRAFIWICKIIAVILLVFFVIVFGGFLGASQSKPPGNYGGSS